MTARVVIISSQAQWTDYSAFIVAGRKGESARADIVAQFSQGKVAELVVERLKGVERVVRDRRRAL